jgi:hypothetical protein
MLITDVSCSNDKKSEDKLKTTYAKKKKKTVTLTVNQNYQFSLTFQAS